jgi:hypothetical protein
MAFNLGTVYNFFSFFVVATYCVLKFLRDPLKWWIAKKGLSEEQSARLIGMYIPTVKDRLLNLIQLDTQESNSLAYASIVQKSREFDPLSFESVIDLKQNTRFAKFLLLPFIVIIAIWFFNKNILTQSTERIINFSREYSPSAPFQFVISKSSLNAFYNEDFTLEITLQGNAIPDAAHLVIGNQRLKLDQKANGTFTHTFEKIQTPFDFHVEAAGFFSEDFSVRVVNRPELNQFKIDLIYPRYLHRSNEQLLNAGNLEIPEGTEVTWRMKSGYTNNVYFQFASDSNRLISKAIDSQQFIFIRKFRSPDLYEIVLENDQSKNKDRISYSIDVIKDQHPSISVNNLQDSILYKRVLLGGIISDDYGVSQLVLKFSIKDQNDKERIPFTSIPIMISKNQVQQNFFYNWSVDSLTLAPGDKLEYFLQVWDNDGVNGRKSTKTALYSFLIPTEDDLMVQIKSSQNQAEQKIDQSVSKAEKLHDQIEQATQKLKGKQNMSWQDKKMLEDILQQKQSLDEIIKKLNEENKLLDQKKNSFTEQDQRIKEKAEQIQKLMDELLDDETKKLFEELQKLMKENADVNDIQKLLNKLNQNTDNLEKELERMLELFKQLQFDFKFDQALEKLDKQIKNQKELLERTEMLEKQKGSDKKQDGAKKQTDSENPEKNSGAEDAKESSKDLAEEQEKLMQEGKKNAEELKELKKLSEELHNDEEVPEEKSSEEILEDQQESKEMLEQNQPSKSKEPQKQSLQKMQKMQEQMQSAQNSMSMEMDMENLESLRQIVHSLVKLSFDQEALLKQFNELTPNDPRFNTLAQQQLKLKDDAKVLEDSLLALGKRDPFMGSIITKEIGELNEHLDKVIESNNERRRPQASTEMQASMTSINNLALMLDDHFEMMMQMMANAKPAMGKKKQKGQKPSLSEMQQKLNEKIQQLKNSGKTGKQLSEEVAEMAAEQERIRKALEQMQEKMKEGGSTPGDQIPAKMEQTEMELVNKQLTDQLIKRQQEILTRLLETEKSVREQDLDEERKGETAKDYDKEIPKAFEEYLRLKEKEVELLKTVPPKLYPYYKKEVSEYFKRMGK